MEKNENKLGEYSSHLETSRKPITQRRDNLQYSH
jgi:hypothetical protein